MSQPEIFRRCSSCGASSKPGELFCAQCGNAIAMADQGDAGAEANTVAAAEESTAAVGGDATVVKPAPEPETEESQQSQDHAGTGHKDSQTVATPDISRPANVVAPRSREPRVTSRRPQMAARGTIENRMNSQVDKLRRISNIVLDEAAYDSSLRFIFVVGVIFALFLVLLFLSKWIG